MRRVMVHVPAVLVTATLITALLVPASADARVTLVEKVGERETKLQIYGFGQMEARAGDAFNKGGDGLFFQAQRIRVGFNYFHGNMASKLFLDFNQSHSSDEGGLPKMIKDAFIAYRWSDSAFIRLGMIKTPLGMAFTVPGWNLDNVERNGLDKALVLERDFGAMLSGRLIGQDRYTDKPMKTNGLEMGSERQGYGFGYDIGVFNPAGRSGAVIWDKNVLGEALAYVGRLHYDHGAAFHIEGAYAISELAGGPGTEDYSVFDVGVASELEKIELKAEYISGSDVRGVEGWDQQTLALTFGYYVTPAWEVVAKHYMAEAEKGGVDTELGNTYVELHWYVDPLNLSPRTLQRHKLVLSYVIASGDEETWNGIGGYRDNGAILQYQYKF